MSHTHGRFLEGQPSANDQEARFKLLPIISVLKLRKCRHTWSHNGEVKQTSIV